MDDSTISISISDGEKEFIAGQIAAGTYADETEMLHAALAALEREAKLKASGGMITERDDAMFDSDRMAFNEASENGEYVFDNMEALRVELASSEKSGTSSRHIPDIIASVKSKLRANGSL